MVMPQDFPKYGEIYAVDFDPVMGDEIGNIRPALIISNNLSNRYSSTVTLLPITSQPARKDYPFEVALPRGTAGLVRDSRVKANQIRTVDRRRLKRFIGLLPPEYLPRVQRALRVHLDLADTEP